MKSKVSERPLFMEDISEDDVENVGIMQGFMDGEYDDEDENEDDDSMSEKMLDRRPDSPEILMNNLRGDMRSIDARVEELADLVGYNAASETPEGVLALLQPVLAAQQAPQMPPEMMEGIQGGIPPEMPQGMPPMPPEMMGGMPPEMPEGMSPSMSPSMSPEMPQGMPPEMMGGIGALPTDQGPEMGAPVMMAKGGPVQYFRDGSDEDGVTPEDTFPFMDDDTSSFDERYPPEVVAAARERLLAASQQDFDIPDLATEVQRRIPMYEDLMGVDKNLSQAQILFELGQRAFNYGANVDDQGNPLRGSQAARLAGAVRTLPGAVGRITGQMDQQQRGVRAAALQASERNLENMMQNQARMEAAQTAADSRVVAADARAKGTGGPFGASLEGRVLNIFTTPGLMDSYAKGETSDEQNSVIGAAISTALKPKIEYRSDPDTGNLVPVSVPGRLPNEVKEAAERRRKLGLAAPQAGQIPPLSLNQDSVVVGAPSPTFTSQEAPPVYENTDDPLSVNPYLQSYVSSPKERKTLFNQASGTGIFSSLASAFYRTPIIGGIAPEGVVDASEQKKNLENLAFQLSRGIAQNPRFSEGEQKRIFETVDLLPGLADRPEAYAQRVFALDGYLKTLQEDAISKGFNSRINAKDRADARLKAADIHATRKDIGAPLVFSSPSDPRLQQLPKGTRVMINGKIHEIGQKPTSRRQQ
jgi:hypothetical protein